MEGIFRCNKLLQEATGLSGMGQLQVNRKLTVSVLRVSTCASCHTLL